MKVIVKEWRIKFWNVEKFFNFPKFSNHNINGGWWISNLIHKFEAFLCSSNIHSWWYDAIAQSLGTFKRRKICKYIFLSENTPSNMDFSCFCPTDFQVSTKNGSKNEFFEKFEYISRFPAKTSTIETTWCQTLKWWKWCCCVLRQNPHLIICLFCSKVFVS